MLREIERESDREREREREREMEIERGDVLVCHPLQTRSGLEPVPSTYQPISQ